MAGELDGALRVILATDNDAPGNALAEELARRLGRERCWRVRWPGNVHEGAQLQPDYRKDANEVLMADGPERLQMLLAAAEPYPIRGLFKCGLRHLCCTPVVQLFLAF
jgi:twinkle protein